MGTGYHWCLNRQQTEGLRAGRVQSGNRTPTNRRFSCEFLNIISDTPAEYNIEFCAMGEDKTEILARKLKIVERLEIQKSSNVRKSESLRHLIALRFQTSTKTDGNNKSSAVIEEEIIDFAAVVVSLETENIVAAFHQYVMPTERPSLSIHCIQSTGVSQEAVDNGVPLKTCLMLYSNWLTKLEKDIGLKLPSKQDPRNPVTVPVTWSDWDLGTCLPNEARRKRLVYVKHLSSWIDLRTLWIKRYNRVPESLKEAVRRSKLKWKEKEERGLEYATNVANLALALHEKGQEFRCTSKS